MYQEGEIEISKCQRCHEMFPVFTFVADTDMLTAGCVALTALGNRIALTEQRPDETINEIEARVGVGFKSVSVYYIDTPIKPNLSFSEFRKRYKPPMPIYSCIKCGGNSKVVRKETRKEFLGYGTITVY